MAQEQYESTLKNLSNEKRLFIVFGSNWCGYCKMFDKYLEIPEVAKTLEKAFSVLQVNTDSTPGGKELAEKVKGGQVINGVPWFAIVDKQERIVTSSVGSYGNLGYPVGGSEPDMFMQLLKENSIGLDAQDYEILKSHLKRY